MYQCEALGQLASLAQCPSLHLDTHQATAELPGQRGAQLEQHHFVELFFSSSMADVALWLGPYMSISSKTLLYKDPRGPTMQANHNRPKTTQNNRTTRKSPSQICVSPRGKANQTHKRGQSPNANNHKQKICLRTQQFDHCVSHKNMPKTNYPLRPSVKHGDQRIVPAFVSINAENCTCLRAYKIASLSVLSDVLVQEATT